MLSGFELYPRLVPLNYDHHVCLMHSRMLLFSTTSHAHALIILSRSADLTRLCEPKCLYGKSWPGEEGDPIITIGLTQAGYSLL